jgi:hypothetical protein
MERQVGRAVFAVAGEVVGQRRSEVAVHLRSQPALGGWPAQDAGGVLLAIAAVVTQRAAQRLQTRA